jgi:hypothetical protein
MDYAGAVVWLAYSWADGLAGPWDALLTKLVRASRWSSLTECPLNARRDTGVGLPFFLSSSYVPHASRLTRNPEPFPSRRVLTCAIRSRLQKGKGQRALASVYVSVSVGVSEVSMHMWSLTLP